MNITFLTESIVVALYLSVIALLFATRAASWRRDFFLCLYLTVFAIYIVLAPALSVWEIQELTGPYAFVQIGAIVFFLLPLIVVYRSSLQIKATNTRLRLSRWHGLFLVFSILGIALFYEIAIENGLLLRRIGHSALASAQSQLSIPHLVFYRAFSEAFPIVAFVSCVTTLTARANNSRACYLTHLVGSIILVVGMGIFLFINNRMQTVLFTLAIFTAILFFGKNRQPGKPPKISKLKLFFGAAIALSLIFAVQIARNLALSGGQKGALDLTIALMEGQLESTPLYWRLNGVDLAARVTEKGLANASWGDSYVESLAVPYNSLVEPRRATEAKLSTRTNVKTMLTQDILKKDQPDNFSSIITDVWGNFWFFPLPIVGAFIGFLLARCQSILLYPKSSVTLILSVYILIYTMEFEKEFVTLLINIPKFALVPLIIGIFSPFEIVDSIRSAKISAPA